MKLAERNRAVLVGIAVVALAGLAGWGLLRWVRGSPAGPTVGVEEAFAWAAERFADVRGARAVGAVRGEFSGLGDRDLELRVRAGGEPLDFEAERLRRGADGRLRSTALDGPGGRLRLAPSVWGAADAASPDPRGVELVVYLIDDGAEGRVGLAARVARDGGWDELPARTAPSTTDPEAFPEWSFARADLGRVEELPVRWNCTLCPEPGCEVELTLDAVAPDGSATD